MPLSEVAWFVFWVVVIGGGGYSARMLNKLVHRKTVRERR